jgi:hypothetical protein
MYSRFFNIVVCLMWLTTMTWLITQKVVPAIWVGQPPNYQTILEAYRQEPQVGWNLYFNNKPLGWALNTLEGPDAGPKEIHSYVHFHELHLEELTSGWGRALFRMMEQPDGVYDMDIQSMLTIDSLGKLSRIDMKIRLEPVHSVLRMHGVIDGMQLHIDVHCGDFSYATDVPLPQYALLSDALTPQSQLPNLATGQTWTVPALNPLRPASNLVEMYYATVEGKEMIQWGGEMRDTWLVVYRTDPGVNFGTDSGIRGKIWVLQDGTVVQQLAMIFDSDLSFVRLSARDTQRLVKRHKQRIESE